MRIQKYIPILILLLFVGLRLPGLGYDMSNSDAARWHRRSEDFLNALKQKKLKDTYQHYQPGVTIMWIDATVNQIAFSYQNLTTGNPKTLENADYYPIVHGISKGVIVILLGILLFIQMKLITNLFSNNIALLYGLLAAVEPYLLGINRWFHLTSMETYFSFTALLFALSWLKSAKKQKIPKNTYLWLSATFLALSTLSKLTTLITMPMYILIFILNLNGNYQLSNIKKNIKFPLVFFLAFLAAFVVAFPAIWVEPLYVFEKLYSAVTKAVTNDIRGELIPAHIAPLYYMLILLFKTSPVTLTLFAVALIKWKKIKADFYALIIFVNLGFYYAFLSSAEQKIDRYSIAMFPSILLIAAVTLSTLSKKVQKTVIIIIIAFTGYLYANYHPIYSAYYSPVFGGMEIARQMKLYDNSGEYYAQAAQYLNTKGRDINVYLPFNLEAFSYFYKGNINRTPLENSDYTVTSVDHIKDLKTCNSTVEKAFGNKKDVIVVVFKCD